MGWSIGNLKIAVPFLIKKGNPLQKQQERQENTPIMVQTAFRIMFQIIFLMARLSLLAKTEA